MARHRGDTSRAPHKGRKSGDGLSARQRRYHYWALAIGALFAVLLFGGVIWHLIDDGMVDVVAIVPRGHEPSHRWVAELREAGYWVNVDETSDAAATLRELRVPEHLFAPYVAVTMKPAHYVIVGPVPPDAIQRLLTERPAIRGLAVAATTAGPPVDVWAFTKDGRVMLFEHRNSVAPRADQGAASRH